MRSGLILAAVIALAGVLPARAQAPAPTPAQQPNAAEVGNVVSVEGAATVTRNGAPRALKVQDPIFKGDQLRTAANATLGIIFDDETTFNLSANSAITVDNFIYESGGAKNAALFKIVRGTIAFTANEVAKTGDMKITTPASTLGIRGTSGVVEVPPGATPGSTGEVAVKLYADQDGRVGRIELFGAGNARLGELTRAATGFSLRAGGAGRFAAVPLTISPQQMARDRAFVQRAFAARGAGRQMINQRRNLRGGQQRQNQRQQGPRQPGQLQRGGPGQPGLRNNQQNLQRGQNLQRPNKPAGRQGGRKRPDQR